MLTVAVVTIVSCVIGIALCGLSMRRRMLRIRNDTLNEIKGRLGK